MKKLLFPILKLLFLTIIFNLFVLAIYIPICMIFGESGIWWILFYIIQIAVMICFYKMSGKLFYKKYDSKTADKIFLIYFIISIIFSEIMAALVVYNSEAGGWIPESISNSFFTFIDYPIFTIFDTTHEIVFLRMSLCYIIENVIRFLCLKSNKK